MASSTIEARQDMGDRVILNIKTHQDGHRPPDRVIPAML
jgi:glyoxylate reductase